MKRHTVLIMMSLLAIAVGAVAFMIWQNAAAPSNMANKKHVDTPEKVELPGREPSFKLDLAKDVAIAFLPVPGSKRLFSSTSPITNAQYQVAVKQLAVPAPVLPPKLDNAKWKRIVWDAGRSPRGQETNAVLFVKLVDADTYCRWLEKQVPGFHFRLPQPAEKDLLGVDSALFSSPAMSDVYAPRPSNAPGAVHSEGGFWHAPLTSELVDYRKLIAEIAPKVAPGWKALLSPPMGDQGYEVDNGGSYGRPEALPSSFRIMAIPKIEPKRNGQKP